MASSVSMINTHGGLGWGEGRGQVLGCGSCGPEAVWELWYFED